MTGGRDLLTKPECLAVNREATLVRHLIGSGVTALGRANYADKLGDYYTAFFGLSIGLERLAKLILIVNYAIENDGQMPDQLVVRKYGHKLVALANAADLVAQNHNLELKYSRPATDVSVKIIESLNAFAAAEGRYANLAALGDPNLDQHEPIGKWWGDVAKLILESHYFGKKAQLRVEADANVLESLMGSNSMVLFTDELGQPMQNVLSASIRRGQTDIVQRYGRYYTLQVVRWLAELFSSLSRSACYDHGVDAFFGAWEHFETYIVDDSFLRERKIWPLT